MKTFKLVSGILCFVLSLLVFFQSCAAGVSNALSDNGEVGGSAGVFLALGLIAGGVVQIASRKSKKRGGSIAAAIVFVFAGLIGFSMAGSYGDLKIWAVLCFVLALINIISIFSKKKDDKLQVVSDEKIE